MLFPTFTFAVFFAAVFATHTALRQSPIAWKLAMLAASAIFYGWWDPRFCALIAASAIINHLLASLVHASESRKRTAALTAAVVANLGVLGFFKYYGFFIDSLGQVVPDRDLPLLRIVLPVGISFFTFQALSYVIDVHRRVVQPASLLDVAVYLSFFPQLVAGPIVRASEFLPQLAAPRPHRVPAGEAAWLIGRGLLKKVVIATVLAEQVVDPVFDSPSAATSAETLLAMYAYAIQIYADFSGYTDIAIGIALLLGFRFPQNFNNPYRSASMQDFWRRWHMTLSRWLRDYLYIPLGGSRGGKLATYRNLLLTMVLGGLWHGASWTFVVWGLIHGLALAAERLWRDRRPTQDGAVSKRTNPLSWLVTFHVVCFAWVLFRAESFDLATEFFTQLVAFESAGSLSIDPALPWLVVLGALAVQFIPTDAAPRIVGWFDRQVAIIPGALLGMWIAFVAAIGPEGVAPFIYFQF